MNVATKSVAAFLLTAIAFGSGYQYASAVYGQAMAELREEYARAALIQGEKHRDTERKQYDALVQAWSERDKALARVASLASDVDRVRTEAIEARKRLSATTSLACLPEREQLSQCAELLERSIALLGRGVQLAEKSSLDKDAVVRMTQTK